MKKAWIFFLACLLAVSFTGCRGPVNVPAAGGVVDETDEHAPKVIESKDITDFYADYYVEDYKVPERSGSYYCKITTDEDGIHTLKIEGYPESYEEVVDDSLLAEIQAIIDRNKLVEMNGYSKVTSGLPPEYQACHMNVVYASGETLNFKVNNDPDGAWNTELYHLLEKYLIETGHEELNPPVEVTTITHFHIAFNEDDTFYEYGFITMGEDEERFYRAYGSMTDSSDETGGMTTAEVTPELYEGLQQIIEETDMDALHAPETVSFSLDRTAEGYLEIYVDFESGRQIYAEYGPGEIPDCWEAQRTVLKKFMDQYIEEHFLGEGWD
ncbi:MAG: hypothetical protein KBS83_04805 [Lachnospiraceae bacterium]|nr:hypothetical protein [Candidatus Equihabitans merdae]